MQLSSALLIVVGFLELSTVFSDRCNAESSTSYYYDYKKVQAERVYWKYVKRERTVAAGCVLDSGEKLDFNQTYRTDFFLLRCDRINETAVVLTPVKCIMHGQELDRGSSVQQGSFIYTCLEEGGRIGLVITGCVGDKSVVVKFGETFMRKSFLFMCVGEGTRVIHKAVGCVIGGQVVNIHKTINIGKYWYKCSRYGNGGVQVEVMGCVDSTGKQIDAGDKYRDGGFLFHCKSVGSAVNIVFAGCIAKEFGVLKEFKFGEYWFTKPVGSVSYKVACAGDEKSVVPQVVQCIANMDQGRMVLKVGECAKYGTDRMFTCMKRKDGTVVARLVTIEEHALSFQTYTAIEGDRCPLPPK